MVYIGLIKKVIRVIKMTVHTLKCNTQSFVAIFDGFKEFEVRKNDRDYKIGDWLCLREWNENTGYTKHVIKCQVKYILKGGQYGIEDGYVVMGINNIKIVTI
jgi:hypothetical protein